MLCEGASADHPEVVAYQNDVAASHLNIGILYATTGRTDQAETAYRKSIEIREKLSKVNPEKVEYQRYLATAHNNLAVMFEGANRLPEAEGEYLKAIAAYERLARDHPDQVNCVAGVGNANSNLAGVLLLMGKKKEGRERLTLGARLLEEVSRRFPQHTETKLFLGGAYLNRADLAGLEKRHADALTDLDRAIPLLSGHQYQRLAKLKHAECLARLADHSRATAEVAAIIREGPTIGTSGQGDLFYNAACVHALAAAAVSKEQGRPPSEREVTAECYATSAVALLARARDSGYFQDPSALQELRKNPDLDPLRPRDDFRKWLMDASFPADPFAR